MMEAIGRYQIREKLGEGGMAVVYKAYDPSIDRTLAIKFLREERCSDPEYRARFLREARAAGILSQANIATVFDVGEVENRPYIVMEFLEGDPLDEVMKSGEKLSLDKILTYGIQLAKALDYAHGKGIIHRDVKPSNIVRLKSSQTLKVTDFGIARMENKDVTQQTQMGEILGTPQYMSPEQVRGEQVDARSDLFSLGVILYQLITGEKPFDADTLGTLLFRIAMEDPKPLAELAPNTPLSLQRIVEKLLNKKPEKRYQSGKDLAEALIRTLKEVEETAQQKELPKIIPLRIKWTAWMAVAVAMTMILSSIVVYKRQHKAMLDQVIEYGSSLVKFTAVESAVPVLSEDWVSIELFVHDVIERQDFSYLEVLDHNDIVRGSSDAGRIGTTYEQIGEASLLSTKGDVQTQTRQLADGSGVLDFAAPILFQNKAIGRVHLGIPEEPFERVAKLTIYMMIVLMFVTLIAVMIVTYILGNLLSAPIKMTMKGHKEIAEGNYDYRISVQRNDEFGHLFLSFDEMAKSLQEGEEQEADEARVGTSAQ